jgi:pSer/pThr/pTyr-binding forkhead associated (FHA) protein
MTTGKESQPTLRGPLELQLDRAVTTRSGPKKSKAFLMVATGEGAGTVFPLLDGPVIVGRSPDADVHINEVAMSTEHARLEPTDAGFTLCDLGSTNGTYVNGQRLVGTVVLVSGDSVRMGSTTFTFVTREAGVPKGTVKLRNPNPDLPLEPQRRRPVESVAVASTRDSGQYTGSVSLTEVVRKVKTYWVYVRRYGRMAAVATAIGLVFGLAQAWLRPPPGSAWFEMTLVGSGEDSNGGQREEGPQVFVGPDSTFRSLPLIKRTLVELGLPNPTDALATEVQNLLTLQRVGFNSSVWRGEYQAATAERATEFLKKHVNVYVDSELDKLLKVLRTDAEFDRAQEARATEAVTSVRDKLVAFSDEHPEAVPKDAKLPDDARPQLAAGASAERIQQRIATTERALRAAYSKIQSGKARPYLEQVSAAETKIAEARSRGLRDQHPEIKSLLNLQSSMRARANAILAAEPSPGEQSVDPQITSLKQELGELRARLDQVRASAKAATGMSGVAGGDTPVSVAPPQEGHEPTVRVVPAAVVPPAPEREPAASLSQLRIAYGELEREYERAKTEQDALIKKRENTERLLERERMSAEARYNIITPPTPAKASMAKAMAKRGFMGSALGFIVAMVVAACMELRRMLIARGHI